MDKDQRRRHPWMTVAVNEMEQHIILDAAEISNEFPARLIREAALEKSNAIRDLHYGKRAYEESKAKAKGGEG